MSVSHFLISFSIIMMMLSLVSERAANFIKLYFQNKEICIPFVHKTDGKWNSFLKVKLEILAYKQPTVMAEKEREYRVMIVNVLVGILIATLANANFFEIVKDISSKKDSVDISIKGILVDGFNMTLFVGALYMLYFLWSISLILFSRLQEHESNIEKNRFKKPFISWILLTITGLFIFKISEVYHWNLEYEVNFIAIVRHVAGFIVTGMFLSLGSKFWHDLLDVLFKLKNTQQVLSDPKTYTDYDSADKLISYADTPLYDIVERLYEVYKKEIDGIHGVVSHGLHAVLDEKTKLYKKIIEVEITNPEAQGKLDRLKYSGSIQLKYNNFYLKDFLHYRFTKRLTAISNITTDSPICYAFNANSANGNPSQGSFSVYKKDGKYYAKSNLHVFADNIEFKEFETNPNYTLTHKTVQFVVGNDKTQTGQIIHYQFGNIDGYGIDYCVCEVEKRLYDLFIKQIDVNKLINIDEYTMRMFGAYTKYVNFHSYRNPTTCKVEYYGFANKKELYLLKIGTSSSGINNVSHGDSGSQIYYKTRSTDNNLVLGTGILVAKSDDYAYMFIE